MSPGVDEGGLLVPRPPDDASKPPAADRSRPTRSCPAADTGDPSPCVRASGSPPSPLPLSVPAAGPRRARTRRPLSAGLAVVVVATAVVVGAGTPAMYARWPTPLWGGIGMGMGAPPNCAMICRSASAAARSVGTLCMCCCWCCCCCCFWIAAYVAASTCSGNLMLDAGPALRAKALRQTKRTHGVRC